jgi:hypothetical protein
MIDADVIESTTRGTSGQKGPTRADIAQLPEWFSSTVFSVEILVL